MKVSIIGAGRVGSAAAFSMLHMVPQLKEIVLVDIMKELARGEALDLQHAASVLGKKITVTSGGYSATARSRIVVIAAGNSRKSGMSRHRLAKANAGIVRSIAKGVVRHSPNATCVVVTNPLDAMTYLFWKASGLPRHRVLGVGSLLDSARLHSIGYDGMAIGEHGEAMVPLLKSGIARARAGMKKANQSIIRMKGATMYGPAACVALTVKAIAADSRKLMPCSCILAGEYGLCGLAIGVPARVGRKGATPVKKRLTPEQQKELSKAAGIIKKSIQKIMGG